MLKRPVRKRVNMLLVLPPNILKNSNSLFLKLLKNLSMSSQKGDLARERKKGRKEYNVLEVLSLKSCFEDLS
jgi:hypothetical protein